MVLFKRKPVQYIQQPHVSDSQEVWAIHETDEVFTSYEDYLKRLDFLKQKRFICEITGHSGLDYFEALESEKDASDEVDEEFPPALKEPILRKVQFSTISRIDHLVDKIYADFKYDFFPKEHVTVTLDTGDRLEGHVREKSKFLGRPREDGSVKSITRYNVTLTGRPDEEALVDDEHIARDRKVFTKQRLRSFLKNALMREAWNGAPWLVKDKIAEEYGIDTKVPYEVTQEHQQAQRKAVLAAKKNQFEGTLMDLPPGQTKLPILKPKSRKNGRVHADQFAADDYQRALDAHPEFRQLINGGQQVHFARVKGQAGFMVSQGDFLPLAAKPSSMVKPPPPPPPPKYPIEDLELAPTGESRRPHVKYLSNDIPHSQCIAEAKHSSGSPIEMASVGALLETWVTLNVFCQVFQLDSFTFDDYVDALSFKVEGLNCELLVEIHCAVLKKLVNDTNDKNGQVQITLPDLPSTDSEMENSTANSSTPPTPEPEVPVPARSTRSSLRKSEVIDTLQATNGLSISTPTKLHRAAEIDQYAKSYDWKARLRKRDLGEGKWILVIVGLLNQLSGDARDKPLCDQVLSKLAPLDQDAVPETALTQYTLMDINTRVLIVQLLCKHAVGTVAIRDYMEDCTRHMTDLRKEKFDYQRSRKTAIEELRVLDEERRALQPASATPEPPVEIIEAEDAKMDTMNDETEPDEDVSMGTEDEEEPHQGRSLRRGQDRAAERKRRADAEKERKAKEKAEKAKKPSKEERQLGKVNKKIDVLQEQIREFEEEVSVIENDLREADCPRIKGLGKDRFWNRYYWMERNAMPYAGLPDSSTASAGYANGCIWVQGPDDIERMGFIELSDEENEQYRRAFYMSVPERKMYEEGYTHVFTANQWGYYDDPESVDELIGWLDQRGNRESKLRKELHAQRDKITAYMTNRKAYLAEDDKDKDGSATEPLKRVSTRTKTYVDTAGHRCLKWRNLTALNELGHLHSEPKPPTYKKSKKGKQDVKQLIEDEGRVTRATNRQGKTLTRQGSRYNF